MIVLDTHVWIWFVSNPDLLSFEAHDTVQSAMEKKEILISSISTWEIALLVKRKRLEFSIDVTEWISHSEKLPFITFVPVDNTIALKSINLTQPFHDDPADRIIMATAISTGSRLVTRDRKIRDYTYVETVW
ncbi:MAG: type II toxin-antitoxin system VapC family toxin [Proteobacteria bacterium]|nr:type II toxin-antitoxin system VapC family toxin [Pseudomonadota bacterium]